MGDTIVLADEAVLAPAATAEETYATMDTALPLDADFSNHRDCGHWRS